MMKIHSAFERNVANPLCALTAKLYGQDSLFEPEDRRGRQYDGRHEGVGAAVISQTDASSILQLCKQALIFVALTVQEIIVGYGFLAILP